MAKRLQGKHPNQLKGCKLSNATWELCGSAKRSDRFGELGRCSVVVRRQDRLEEAGWLVGKPSRSQSERLVLPLETYSKRHSERNSPSAHSLSDASTKLKSLMKP